MKITTVLMTPLCNIKVLENVECTKEDLEDMCKEWEIILDKGKTFTFGDKYGNVYVIPENVLKNSQVHIVKEEDEIQNNSIN